MAGIGPQDVDVAELYDAYTGAELQAISAYGLAAPERVGLQDFGAADRLAVNLSGGLLGQGAAPGATGIAWVVALARILTGLLAAIGANPALRAGRRPWRSRHRVDRDGDGTAAVTIPLSMTLRYNHPLGARSPYFEGLSGGRAIASRCAVCGCGWFPPRHCCGTGFHWEDLPGAGTVVAATDGFALVAMDGARNLALAKLREPAQAGVRVRIVQAAGPVEHPAQASLFQVETGNCIASE